jgi:hypothetical protein
MVQRLNEEKASIPKAQPRILHRDNRKIPMSKDNKKIIEEFDKLRKENLKTWYQRSDKTIESLEGILTCNNKDFLLQKLEEKDKYYRDKLKQA